MCIVGSGKKGDDMPVSSGTNTRVLVYNAVVNWLAPRVNLKPEQIDVGRTFSEAPPDGYGQTGGAFMKMCDDISETLSKVTGRALSLPNSWRAEHQDDEIATYINEVAIALMAAPMNKSGKKGLGWAMALD